ncbi:WhiB family transcriptional regulator [Gordonia terrae]
MTATCATGSVFAGDTAPDTRTLSGSIRCQDPTSEDVSNAAATPEASQPGSTKVDRDRVYRHFHNGSNVELPPPLAEGWEWQLQARCRERSIEEFYPPQAKTRKGRWERRQREHEAVALCHSCTVIQQCREYALSAREPYGVWGGLTEDERMDILYYGVEVAE